MKIHNKSIGLKRLMLRIAQIFVLFVVIEGCNAKKALLPAKQSLTQSKVEMSYTVGKSMSHIEVSTSDPVVLRTFIMQGFSLSISGQYLYTVQIPSAKEVESNISHHPGEVKATMQGDVEKRPDIRPILEALNKVDALIYSKTGEKVGKAKNFSVSINPQTGLLTYKISLSTTYSMNMPVNVTLSSVPVDDVDEFKPDQFTNRNESNQRQPFGVGQTQQPNEKHRDITIKYSFR